MRFSAIALLLVLSACAPSPRHDEMVVHFPGAPVVLISIDTLRSDRLPAYGYRGVETPAIDAFRHDAILFTRAWSHSPMTLPSHASMLTGLLPADHGVRDNTGYRLDAPGRASLPCLLAEKGISSGAAVSSYVMRSESGISGCFDFYDDAIDPRPDAKFGEYQRSGLVTLRASEGWITEQAGAPFFFLFHIYEPHLPYSAPEPFRSRYRDGYDAEIAAADAVVGRFLDFLREKEIYDKALIILTSDHGEGLGDHGEQQHSILLYREAIQVPLIVKLPGAARAGTTVDVSAQLIDVYATIAAAAEIDPRGDRGGKSLLALDDADSDRPVFSETMYPRIHLGWSDLASLVSGRHHYIDGPKPELYDLVADPAEKVNVLTSERRAAAALRQRVAAHRVSLAPPSPVGGEEARRLAALGYLGNARSDSSSAALPNPVDRIAWLDRVHAAVVTAERGEIGEAIALLGRIIEEDPSMVEVRAQLAELLSKAGRHGEAAAAWREALAHSPVVSPDDLVRAGFAHFRNGDLEQAEAHAVAARNDLPSKAEELLARVALARGDLDSAEALARSVAKRTSVPSALLLLAEVQQRQGRLEAALATLDDAGRRAETNGIEATWGVDFLRADTLARLERLAEAEAAYRREIAQFPAHLEAWSRLAIVLVIDGRRREIGPLFEEMVAKNRSPAAYEMAARTLEAVDDPRGAESWRRRKPGRRS